MRIKRNKTDKLEVLKTKNFNASKDNINQMKRQPQGENTCKSDMGFVSRIYKELSELNNNTK